MKKFFAFLLTFAMLFSLAMPAMAAEGDTATVYFQNNWQWTDVRAYIHYTDGTENAAYPGVAMTFHENDGTYDVYSVTFPVSNIDYIIFSGIKDDGSGARDATPQIPSSELYRNATYYCMWNDGNTYGREGGEGESLDSAAAPSGPSITGGTTGDVSASYTPTPEAKWGTSKDNLTESGTLAEAFIAAADDPGITYIQLQTSVTTDTGYDIDSGIFTLDMNGNTLTNDPYVIALRNAAVQVTLTDTASGGKMISMQPSSAAVVISDGQLVIDGGSYSGTYAVNVLSGSAEINGGTFTASYAFNVSNGAILTIHDGTIIGDWTSVVTSGTTTINGGTISAGSTGHIEYWGGSLDLSGYDVNNLTLSQWTDAELTVSDENIKLPEGYVFKDGETTVTTLTNGTIYTIAAEGSEPTYTIETAPAGGGTITAPDSAAAGEIVTVTLNPADGYTPMNFMVLDTVEMMAQAFTKVDDLTYTFVMPDVNVLVQADFCLPGTTLDTIYYKGPWTNVKFAFMNSVLGSAGNAVGTIVESGIYEVGDIPEWSYSFYIFNQDDESQYIEVRSIPTDGKNMYNAYTGEWETYTPSQPEETTSAEITWGNMSFTYYDTVDEATGTEKGWTPADEAGAGTVTVKNTGDTTFTAQASYKSTTEEYGTFTGTFATASSELTAGSSHTFTLELNGKPTKAIPAGTKIGTVTVTIEEYDPVYLNISFGSLVMNSNREIGHSRHTVRFYDANGSLLSETAESNSATETVAVPNGAETFELYYKPYDRTQGELPVDRSWQTTARNEVPAVDSDVSIAFTDPYTTTVTVTAAQ